jgi:hypothetical protein
MTPTPEQLPEALPAGPDGPPAPEPVGEAWLAELRRRSAQIESGEAVLSPWTDVKRRVWARACKPVVGS